MVAAFLFGACRQAIGIDQYFNASADAGGGSPADGWTTACGLPYGTNACASCACDELLQRVVRLREPTPRAPATNRCYRQCNGEPACWSQCTDRPSGGSRGRTCRPSPRAWRAVARRPAGSLAAAYRRPTISPPDGSAAAASHASRPTPAYVTRACGVVVRLRCTAAAVPDTSTSTRTTRFAEACESPTTWPGV